MITALIGHRGVGKTNLLRRLDPVSPNFVLKDLDAEVEAGQRESIDAIFRHLGEAQFRRLEREAFENLYREHDRDTHLILAVGAGFEFSFPSDVRVIWVRRPTDKDGRIFLDRPTLGEKSERQSPLAIWESRFSARDERYRGLAHEELMLPEGSLHDPILEEHFFMMKMRQLPYALTALPENFRSRDFFDRRRLWGLKWLEVRDDLLSQEQIARLEESWPVENLLYSIRKTALTKKPKAGAVDWPLELGMSPFEVEILSLHERSPNLSDTLERFPKKCSSILKLAVNIESFDELLAGHQWWEKDPQNRAFLPCSKTGRWQWYRQLYGPQMPIHFFREGDGTSLDQPYFWQSLIYPKARRDFDFAAVLGSPVRHSWTPTLQREFFDERMIPVVAIDVEESEWQKAISVLQTLGLRYAAVTSPHKQNAYALAKDNLSDSAKKFQSVNTLALALTGWSGHNTDAKGATGLFYEEFFDDKRIVVWGGGGTKEMLKEVLPTADFVSAREGMKLTESVHLVWAVSRSRSFVWPQPAVYVHDVIDLNYTEDSPGREIALLAGAPYKSGETMFIHQGLAQREFWKRYL